LQCVLAARILTVDFVVCTLAVKKKSGQVSICRIGPFPCKTDESSPYYPILCLLGYIFILSFHILQGLSSGLFPFSLSRKICMPSSSLLYVLHALPISYSLTRSFNNISLRDFVSKNYECNLMR
jgi:hypothetical protein